MNKRSFRACRSCGDIHQVDRWPHNCMPPQPNRSDLPAPYVIRDGLPGGVNGLFHHGVARKIDSKAGYRAATKASGCIEVGNEFKATRLRPQAEIKEALIEQAIHEAIQECGMDDGKGDDSITVTQETKHMERRG